MDRSADSMLSPEPGAFSHGDELTNLAPDVSLRAQSAVLPLVQAIRPRQWIKNGVVASALIFAGRLNSGRDIAITAWAMLIFCAVSSSGYLVNDLLDAERDRNHPVRRSRSIASGALDRSVAIVAAGCLAATGLVGAFVIQWRFGLAVAGYLLLTFGYSWLLKHLPVLDVVSVASGFVIRAVAGALAISVPVSLWLIIVTGLLALFIVLAKRSADPEPAVLWGRYSAYPASWLNAGLAVAGVACLGIYVLYSLAATNLPHDHAMLLTAPFVAAGLWRFGRLSRSRSDGTSPPLTLYADEALLRDSTLLRAVLAWALCSITVLYWIR